MKTKPFPTTEGERVWQRFRLHFVWPEGFALLFLFSSNIRLTDLFRRRLEATYRSKASKFHRVAVETPDALAPEIMGLIRRPSPRPNTIRAPLWIELNRSRAPEWQSAEINLLARLNEHRELLRATRESPVVFVLPGGFGVHVRRHAPDLWSIRDFSVDLDEKTPVAAAPGITSGERCSVIPKANESNISPDPFTMSLIEEWERLRQKNAADHWAISAGCSAVDAAIEAGLIETARTISRQLVPVARKRLDDNIGSDLEEQALRDLGIALEKAGDAAGGSGGREEAKKAYEESLRIRRKLHEALGEAPRVIRRGVENETKTILNKYRLL